MAANELDTKLSIKGQSIISNENLLRIQRYKEEMLKSLAQSVRSAGGDPEPFLREDLTLGEMLDGLAQNGIRFCFDKDRMTKSVNND